MMGIISGLFWIISGVFLIWMGSIQFIGSMLPHDFAMIMAEKHGAWMRENLFNLPPIGNESP